MSIPSTAPTCPVSAARHDRGATGVEYGIIIGIIALVLVAAVSFLGRSTDASFAAASTPLSAGDQQLEAAAMAADGAPAEPAAVADAAAAAAAPAEPAAPAEAAAPPDTGAASARSGDTGDERSDEASDEGSGEPEGSSQPERRAMTASDWVVLSGTATLSGTDVTSSSAKWVQTIMLNATPWTSDDITLSARMALIPLTGNAVTDGYGIWLRATPNSARTGVLSGYSFQVDPGQQNQFVLRVWNNGAELSQPVAVARFPRGFDPQAQNDITVRMEGGTFTATVNGEDVMEVDDVDEAVADAAAKKGVSILPPTGTAYGLRTWGKVNASMAGTTVR